MSCNRIALALPLLAIGGFPGSGPRAEDPQPPPPLVQTAPGRAYANLSLDVLAAVGTSTEPDVTALELGGHDPNQRGFTIQNVELVVDGAVDPYFRGQANVVFFIGPDGETEVELEEAYATTTSLPRNLQVKAGQFFTEFGRLNPQHPHAWDFVDQPIVNGRFFGPDGLRSAGARVSWLMPAPFYSELFFTVQNARGETLASFGSREGETLFGRPIVGAGVGDLGDLLYVPRYTASFDLSSTQTLLAGASAAVGPNGTGPQGRTHIYGVDFFYKWKPVRAEKGFPFVKVQAEAMRRAFRASAIEMETETLPRVIFRDSGLYVQALWGFRTRWVAGARYERVYGSTGDAEPDDPLHEPRFRASANVSWFPTEYSKLRLQVNYDGRERSRDATSVWLQLEVLLGAHAAHKF